MKISVIGLGYIGLPTALLLAKNGADVVGVDINNDVVASLRHGVVPFEEQGLTELFDVVQQKQTFFVSESVKASDVYIIAVPTPVDNGSADLRFVLSALASIKETFQEGALIIIESTVGPMDCIKKIIPEIQTWGKHFLFAHCSERAIPGNTIYEMIHNDRVIGGMNQNSLKKAKEVYTHFVTGALYETDPTTAAVCKVMENTFRSANIALANEFARLADEFGYDVWEAIELANKHPRVSILQPGPGVGGHCIPIDPYFFVGSHTDSLIAHIQSVNENMANVVRDDISTYIQEHAITEPKIGILGYAYKKDVDDTRETPAEKIYAVLSETYDVFVTDPFIPGDGKKFMNEEELLAWSNVLVLVTDHTHYKTLDFRMYPNIVFLYDSRNALQDVPVKKYTLGNKKTNYLV